MFKPTAKIKKLLLTFGNNIYIFSDGVVILEKRTVKIEKDLTQDVDVWHYIPCEIPIRARMYDQGVDAGYRTKPLEVDWARVDGRVLVHGCKAIEVTLNCASESSRNAGVYVNKVRIVTPDEGYNDVCWIANMWQSSVNVYPDPTDRMSYSYTRQKKAADLLPVYGNVITHEK